MRLPSWNPMLARACLIACLQFPSAQAADQTTPVSPTNRIELCNGKDLAGWKAFMRDNADSAQTWQVERGILKCTGKAVGYLRTEQSYRDYKLTVEWRFVKIAPRADNTGILVHMVAEDKLWPRCLQCQGQHGKLGELILMDGADCKEHQGLTTDRFPTRDAASEKPVGEWNNCEIVCAGDTVKIYVNGKLTNEATGCNVTSGRIGFQSEGAEFEVRKVSLEPAK